MNQLFSLVMLACPGHVCCLRVFENQNYESSGHKKSLLKLQAMIRKLFKFELGKNVFRALCVFTCSNVH